MADRRDRNLPLCSILYLSPSFGYAVGCVSVGLLTLEALEILFTEVENEQAHNCSCSPSTVFS
jgi:hypothetical protein